MTAPRIGGGHVPIDPGTGKVWGSDGAGNAVAVGRGGSTTQLAVVGRGLIAEAFDVGAITGATALATQTIYGSALGLHAGDVIANVVINIAVAASGTAPTTVRFGLADSTGKVLVLSANLNAATSWTAVGQQAFALAYTVPTDGLYFPCVVVNGTWGSTQPTVGRRQPSSVGQAYSTGAPPYFGQIAQADLPAVNSSVTLTAQPAAGEIWMAVA